MALTDDINRTAQNCVEKIRKDAQKRVDEIMR